jgi:two-component system OmpR family sensor kinase
MEYARAAAIGAAAPILIVIPLSWLVLGWAINRALGQLGALAHDIGTRSASGASPLPLDGVPTELVPLVASMNGLIARLRAAVDAQRRFVSDAAHELRTPLAAMQIQVDNLALAESAKEPVHAIARGVRRAGDLVNQLLRLARLEDLEPTPGASFDLGALVLDCLGDQALLAERQGIDLAVHLDVKATLRGSEMEIRVLVVNLLDNAVRYTPPGGAIEVRLHRSEMGRNMLDVLDTGPGLPPGSEARIFERFYRAAPADVEGSGLGLAIAKRVAERHGLILRVANRSDGQTGVLARVTLAS